MAISLKCQMATVREAQADQLRAMPVDVRLRLHSIPTYHNNKHSKGLTDVSLSFGASISDVMSLGSIWQFPENKVNSCIGILELFCCVN